MKTFWEKIKNSELAIGLLCGAGGLLVVAAIIMTVIGVVNKKTAELPISPTVSKITLDYGFDKTYSEQTSSAAASSAAPASSAPAVTSSAPVQQVKPSVSGKNQVTNSRIPEQNDYGYVYVSSTPYKPYKPAGTLAKVSAADYAGLAKRNKARAIYLSDVFYNSFFIERDLLLLDEYPIKKNVIESSAWGYGALQSMQAAVAKADKNAKQISRLKKVNEGLDYYGRLHDGKFWGYVVRRGDAINGARDDDLAYDDNMWIAINLVRSYELTGDKAYLNRAKYLVKFIITDAWFEPLGGIFWDTRHEARHSCSNNPMIKLLVDIYKHTGDKYYLNWAVKVYNFARTNLKCEEKNIYNDLVGAHKEGDVWVEGNSANTGFYSYNTGTMISGAAALYGATGDKKYLDEALSCAQGAMDYFGDRGIMNGYTGFACTSNIWFNAILLRGYIDLYPYAKKETAKYIEEFQKSMDFAYEKHGADSMGVMPYDWMRGWDSSDRSTYRTALDMSANAEMYGMLATWQKTRTE